MHSGPRGDRYGAQVHDAPATAWREATIADNEISIEAVTDKRGRARFVDAGRDFAAQVENAVPQLRREQLELIDPGANPFFEHARVQLFLAVRGGRAVGRISAHIDELALAMPVEQGFGPGTGMFGYFDARDETTARALLQAAETWLRGEGMTRAIGPISLSYWEEVGLLVDGHDHPPTIMMGHHPAHYAGWIEGNGYDRVKTLYTYELGLAQEFPPLIRRIVASGKGNDRIRIRRVRKARWDDEAQTIMGILNDAWSNNWGFVPITPAEIAHTRRKLGPIIHEELNMIAELDGRPVAFMMTFPDLNDVLARIDGRLLPLGWLRLLRWLQHPRGSDVRVPLMGVRREVQNSRLASQLAFMMIDAIKQEATGKFGSTRAEIGWILDDNRGMIAVADAIGASVNREYAVYERALA